jgi:hypothetical protein
MIESLPTTSQPAARERGVELRPSFFSALRGVWLFTWRSQLTLQRLPLGIFALLVLPGLVYLTTASFQRWSRHQGLSASNPAIVISDLSKSLARSGNELRTEQRSALLRMLGEEFAHLEQTMNQSTAAEVSVDEQADQIKACHERVLSRAQTILDENQFLKFEAVEKHRLKSSLANAKMPRWGRTGPFYHWLIDFYFFVLLPLGCARSCGAIIREELQADTLSFLTTRPVSRARLLVVKYLSQTAWLQIIVLIETLLLFAVGGLREVTSLGLLVPLFLGTQFLAVLAWCALGTLFGLITKRYMAIALLYGMIVEMGIGRIPTNINTLSLMRHLKILLSHNPALQSIYDWPTKGTVVSLAALLFASALFVTLAALLFTFKEYHHTSEIQK